MGKQVKPDFQKGDKIAVTSNYRGTTSSFYFVKIEPYLVEDEWRMVVQSGGMRERQDREVLCSNYHLVGSRSTKKVRKPLINKEKVLNIAKKYKAPLFTAIVLFVLLLIGMWFVGNYNSLVSAENGVDNRWAKVEVQYQRRLDLITNYVAVAKGAQVNEQKIFGQIADARKQYDSAKTDDEKAQAATTIESINIVPRLQEAYPELKSNQTLNNLATEIAGTENSIAGVRNDYNDAVTNYNTGITRFPKNLFAGLFGYDERTLFSGSKAAAEAPKVNFQ